MHGNWLGIRIGGNGGVGWTSPEQPLGGETPNFWVKEGTRSGLTLPDTVNPGAGDASILLPYLYKPTGDEFAYVDDASKLDIGTSDLTLCGWAKSENNDKAAYHWIMGKSIGGNGYGTYCIFQDITTGYLRYRVYSSGTYVNVATTVDFTTLGWAFLRLDINIATFKVRFFVNEVQQGTDQSFTGNFTPSAAVKFTIGAQASTGIYPGRSSHSDTYVYRKLLSPTEGATLMARGFVTGATAHWPLNEFVKNASYKFYDVSGNGYHLTTVTIGATKRVFGAEGSRYLLNKGYTLYSNIALNEFIYVGNAYAGTQLLADTLDIGGYNFAKRNLRSGSLTNYNKAESIVSFAGANYDRSNATIYNANARLGFYDAAHPKYWRASELDQELIDSFLTAAYRDIHFLKGNTDSLDTCNYLEEFISYDTVKTGTEKSNVLLYTNDTPLPLDYIDIVSTQTAVISQVALILVVATNRRVLIDWGDGTAVVTATGSATYTSNYTAAGTYHIKIYRDLDSLTGFTVNNATLSGNISEFNKATGLTTLSVQSGGWIGDIDALTSPLVELTLNTTPGTYGSIDSLPATITALILYGTSTQEKNNYYGSLDNLPPNLVQLGLAAVINGQITGDTDNLPASLLTIDWEYTELDVTGKIDTLPSRAIVTHFCGSGPGGTWTGSVNSLTSAALNYISFGEMPDVTFDIGTIQNSVKIIGVTGSDNGNISGNLNAVPTAVEVFSVAHSTAVAGNIEDLPATVNRLSIVTCPNVIYNGGNLPAWVLIAGIRINNSWASAMVDAFLINAAARLPHNVTNQIIKLDYVGMGARTAASDAAMVALATNHYVITTN